MKVACWIFCSIFSVLLFSCYKDKTSEEHCKNLINDPDTFSVDSGGVWVPNAITPNGDGLNDVFIPFYDNVESAELKVFTTDGKVIFQTGDKTTGFIPENLPKRSDEYLFKVQATLKSGRRLGVCGKFHAIKCLNKDLDAGSLRFLDQVDPRHGFVLPTSENLEKCTF
jgi:hypothetical protein